MKYELGRILSFNNAKWGLLEYKGDNLVAYSAEEKREFRGKVPFLKFRQLYANSTEICKETIEYASYKADKLKNIKKNLKHGVIFIGKDDAKYTFLNVNKDKIKFYDNNKKVYTANIEFIKELTDKIDETYINHLESVKTKKEYNALTDKEKVQTALNEFKIYNRGYLDTVEIVDVGSIVSGTAYYHEVDEYYQLIGLQIKIHDKTFGDSVGFYPIYKGRIKDFYPTHFQDSYAEVPFEEHMYSNSMGDEVEVDKVLIPKTVVDEIYKTIK